MIQAFVFVLVFCMSVIAAHAQKPSDFSGKWTLDVAKSKLGDRNTIESQSMTVTQTAADIKIETATKRVAPPAGAPAGGPPGGGGRGGMMGGGDGTATYKLDGKGVESEMPGGQMGTMKVTTTAKLDGGKLLITRSVTTPMGDRTTTEKWWLNADGTLSVETQRPNRDGGMDTTTKVFAKR